MASGVVGSWLRKPRQRLLLGGPFAQSQRWRWRVSHWSGKEQPLIIPAASPRGKRADSGRPRLILGGRRKQQRRIDDGKATPAALDHHAGQSSPPEEEPPDIRSSGGWHRGDHADGSQHPAPRASGGGEAAAAATLSSGPGAWLLEGSGAGLPWLRRLSEPLDSAGLDLLRLTNEVTARKHRLQRRLKAASAAQLGGNEISVLEDELAETDKRLEELRTRRASMKKHQRWQRGYPSGPKANLLAQEQRPALQPPPGEDSAGAQKRVAAPTGRQDPPEAQE
mmetsp:Transcript_74202/g.206239  ORF Transcript_74202/g.206239 Transcript_74202/m.206239 type:complete len:280 (-) Transcript_74202:102-941(-)